MSLNNLIYIAYDARVEGQLVAPDWAGGVRFDIDAKSPLRRTEGQSSSYAPRDAR
jgi:uncharacterized protein (TIGR03435 family)